VSIEALGASPGGAAAGAANIYASVRVSNPYAQ